jgi:2-keto-4-pentenoate hydratase
MIEPARASNTWTDDVRRLYEARRDGGQAKVQSALTTFDEALAMQLDVAETFAANGDPVAAWKIALTSGGSLDRLGRGYRPFGYIPQSRLLRSGESVVYDRLLNCRVEPELCLVLGRPFIGSDVTQLDARAAVSSVAIAFEINETRVPDGIASDPASVLADGAGNWGVVVGDEVPTSEFEFAATTAEAFRDGRSVGIATVGRDLVIDDPFVSLARMCRLLAKFGRGLEAGQPVITGSFSHFVVNEPARWSARMSHVGDVRVDFI